ELGAFSNAVLTIIDDETPMVTSPAGEFNIVWPQDSFGFQQIPLQATPLPNSIVLPFTPGLGFFFTSYPQYVVTENETTIAPFANQVPTVNEFPGRSTR